MSKPNKYFPRGTNTAKPHYRHPLKGLEIKDGYPNLVELRRLLAMPQNLDIMTEAAKGQTFGECLGIIAARFNILLEGDYDVEKLCEVLCASISRRNEKGIADKPHLQHPSLVPARVEEREEALHIELAKLPAAKTADEATVTKHNIFMIEQSCKVCDDREACSAAQKCLGREEGFGIQRSDA